MLVLDNCPFGLEASITMLGRCVRPNLRKIHLHSVQGTSEDAKWLDYGWHSTFRKGIVLSETRDWSWESTLQHHCLPLLAKMPALLEIELTLLNVDEKTSSTVFRRSKVTEKWEVRPTTWT